MFEVEDKVIYRESEKIGTVVGFSETYQSRSCNFGRRPGIYKNRCWVWVRFGNRSSNKPELISSTLLDPVNKREYNQRFKKPKLPSWKEWEEKENFICDPPDTKFWEGDIVRLAKGEDKNKVLTVLTIKNITSEDKGNDEPLTYVLDKVFKANVGHGSYERLEDKMVLVERGNIWKYYHYRPLRFVDSKEAAEFFEMTNLTGNNKSIMIIPIIPIA